jgi:type IV secretion system protein VirB5
MRTRTPAPPFAACAALLLATPAAALFVAPRAEAAMAVIDVAAIRQLAQQVTAWREQLRGMSNQLAQLRETHGALTGGRGMDALLPTAPQARNYLPEQVAALEALTRRPGRYGHVADEIARLVRDGAVLPDARLGQWTAAERATLEQERERHARVRALMGEAYAQTSARFNALQQLIDAVGTAPDAKAIADLQGRIAAEQAMLANEHTKLFALQAVAQAEQAAAEARRREQALAAHGRFEARFRPANPAP